MSPAPLESELRRLIAIAGPMPVWEYMNLCLTHPQHGYYTTRDPFGRGGDFTTAPEISQVFGELIGIWAAAVWQQMGSPEMLRLVELGPGRGTMMLDMLRAARVVPNLRSAVSVHLVEISPVLERIQRQTLEGVDVPLAWHRTIEDVPTGPTIVVANEFFDALPVHQAVKFDGGWHERAIGIDTAGKLAFVPATFPLPGFAQTLPESVRAAPAGAIFEWRSHEVVLEIGRRLVRGRGAALVIDYGHTESGCGDTLQAVSRHAFADPLSAPGLADLTAHVDFAALAAAAESIGACAHGPLTQGEFLLRLGLERRAETLKSKLPPDRGEEIDGAMYRLVQAGPDGMGRLFKVLAIADPQLGTLPGFDK